MNGPGKSKSRPNQVDPYGEAHLYPGRRTATLTGNRQYGKSWICCSMDRSWRKEGRQYLRLFFLDGATALAAGFRPCNRCQRRRRELFADLWGSCKNGRQSTAEIDAQLARERGTLVEVQPATLPTGAMIDIAGDAWLVIGGQVRRWSFDGYGPLLAMPERALLITPVSTVEVIRAGFPAHLHPSAMAA